MNNIMKLELEKHKINLVKFRDKIKTMKIIDENFEENFDRFNTENFFEEKTNLNNIENIYNFNQYMNNEIPIKDSLKIENNSKFKTQETTFIDGKNKAQKEAKKNTVCFK